MRAIFISVELSQLTYAECKVINLGRIYVSVKRIFLIRASYARSDASVAPLFHQKNVVAYLDIINFSIR